MAEGTETYKGLAVPLVGESEIKQVTAATDILTLTAGYTGSTVTIVGQGPNAGLRYAHASGAAVRNADSVHLVVFGGPSSLVKVYAPSVGEFGEIVGPKRDGLADQFWSLAWKWWGGYGRLAEACRLVGRIWSLG